MSRGYFAIGALVLVLVAGCGSGSATPAAPTTEITLSLPTGSALPNTTKTVRLSVGQTLGVRAVHSDAAGYWQQTGAGDTAVLAQDGAATTTGDCPTDTPGCGSTSEQRYRAASAGTSTVVWSFLGLGPGRVVPGAPTVPCQGDAGQRCPVGLVRIAVTVGS